MGSMTINGQEVVSPEQNTAFQAREDAYNPLNQPVVSGPGAIDAYHAIGNRPPADATEQQLNNMIQQKAEYDKYIALRNAAEASAETTNGLDGVNKILQSQVTNTKLQAEKLSSLRILEGQKVLDAAYASGKPQLVQDAYAKYFPDQKIKMDKDASEVQAAADKHINDTLASEKTRDELTNAHFQNAATSFNAVLTSPNPALTYKTLYNQGAFKGTGAPPEYDADFTHNAFIHATSVTDKLDMKNQLMSSAPAGSGVVEPTTVSKIAQNVQQIPGLFSATGTAVGAINPQAQPIAVPPPGPIPQGPQQAAPPQAIPQQQNVSPQAQTGPSIAPQQAVPVPQAPVAPGIQPGQPVPIPPDVQAALARHNQQAQAAAVPTPEVAQAISQAAPAEAQQAAQLNIGQTGHVPELGAAKTQNGTPITEATVQHIMKATGADRGRAIDLIKTHMRGK